MIPLDSNRMVRRCGACGLIAIHPLPSFEDVEERYEPDVFSGSEDEFAKPSNRLKKQRFEEAISLLKSKYGKSGGKLLDFGCGMGAFMNLARERGFDPTGVDISPHAVDYVRKRLAMPAFAVRLSESGLPQRQFDVITLWDVLHDTYDPLAILRELRPYLKDDGILVVKVLNADGLIFGAIRWAYRLSFGRFSYPVRVAFRFTNFYFSKSTLALAFEKCGFRMNHVYAESHKDFGSLAERSWGRRAVLRHAARLVYGTGRALGMQEEIVAYATKETAPPSDAATVARR